MRKKQWILALLLVLTLVPAFAQRRHRDRDSGNKDAPGQFDYYLLSLSWSPNFCEHASRKSPTQCGVRSGYHFVVHGLWPQYEQGGWPEKCQSVRPVARATVDKMLQIMPDQGLIQHEWERHGSCSGMDADRYFETVENANTAVKIPVELDSIRTTREYRPVDIQRMFAEENNAPVESFAVSCQEGELTAVSVCMSKDLKFRACSRTVKSCRDKKITVLAPLGGN